MQVRLHVQVANAYGAGLTDWDQSSLYGKLCIFAFAAWGGQNDGVIAGLAVCGIMLSVTSAACGELATGMLCVQGPRTHAWVPPLPSQFIAIDCCIVAFGNPCAVARCLLSAGAA